MLFFSSTSVRARRGAVMLSGATAAAVVGALWVAPAQAGTAIPSVPSPVATGGIPRVIDDEVIPNSGVRELHQVGDIMYVGGEFNEVVSSNRRNSYTRTNLFSFDANNGDVTDFAPLTTNAGGAVAGGDVYAMESTADGRYLYVGGDFRRWDGKWANKIVKLDTSDNTVVRAFRSPLKSASRVSDLQLVNGRLFVSGTMPGGIVALDPDTGVVDPYFDGVQATGNEGGYSTRIYRFSVNPAGDRMAVIGSFTAIGGEPRQQAAMLTLGATSAGVSGWTSSWWELDCSARWRWYTRDVDWSLDGSHFAIVSAGGPYKNTLCDAVTWWDTSDSPSDPTWVNYSGGDTFHSVHVTDKAVFVGGHFRWLDNPEGRDSKGPGAVNAKGLGAINPDTGKALDWNPNKGIGGGDGAFDLYFTDRGLWVGHFEKYISGRKHEGVGLLPY